MSIINAYGDSTITIWELDNDGQKISVPIQNESKQVIGNKIILEGLPDEQYRVFIDGFVEIDIKEKITEPNQFKVAYRNGTGVVYVHPDLDGQWITISRYYSKGLYYIPSSRIWTKLGSAGEVIETLEDTFKAVDSIVGDIDNIISISNNAIAAKNDLLQAISDADNINTTLNAGIASADSKILELGDAIVNSDSIINNINTAIANADSAKSNLDNKIAEAVMAKDDLNGVVGGASLLSTNLESLISTGTTLNDSLFSNIQTGNTLLGQLSNIISDANTAKDNLDGSVSDANIIKGELDSSIISGASAKSSLDGSISTAVTKKVELDTSITSADAINDTLSNETTGTIKEATDINSTLNTTIGNAGASKSDLDTSISNASTSKTNLDASVVVANTSKSDLDSTISEANTKKAELDASISSASSINDTLANPTTGSIKKATDIDTSLGENILLATTKDSDLSATVVSANASKDNLDTSISDSSVAKSNLDDSIHVANTTKTALDSSISDGNVLKGELDDIIAGTDYEQIVIDVNALKQDQHNHTNKATLDGLSDVGGKLKYNGQDVGVGDMTKAIYDTNNDGKVDMANDSEKLGGELPSHYAKVTDIPDISGKADITYVNTEIAGAKSYTDTKVADLVGSAPETLDTLHELAEALGNDANFATTIATEIGTKADKTYVDTELGKKVSVVSGKQLSTEDYTTVEKNKLAGIEAGAEKNKVVSVSGKTGAVTLTKADVGLGNVDNTSDINKPISTATQTALNGKVDNSRVLTDVPANAKFTDTITSINGKTGAIAKADIVALGIPAQDTVYTHPTTAGNKHIPSGGTVGQILKNTASGTATWQAESVTPIANNLTETVAGKALDATQGKVLDDKIGILNGNLTELEYSELSSTATNIDSEGIYKNIEWKRKNNTIYAKSTLLGTTPNYNQVKMDYYDESGITIIKSITWDISYDNNGFSYQRMVI